MGTITSGVGLISGINTGQLIDQLIAIDSAPVTSLQQRNQEIQARQVAFQDINAKLLALKLSASSLADPKLFGSTTATSSNPTALTATTSAGATPGTYDFTVSRLVS